MRMAAPATRMRIRPAPIPTPTLSPTLPDNGVNCVQSQVGTSVERGFVNVSVLSTLTVEEVSAGLATIVTVLVKQAELGEGGLVIAVEVEGVLLDAEVEGDTTTVTIEVTVEMGHADEVNGLTVVVGQAEVVYAGLARVTVVVGQVAEGVDGLAVVITVVGQTNGRIDVGLGFAMLDVVASVVEIVLVDETVPSND